MDTVIGYLKKYQNKTFEQMPMNEVDSLALCQLSYLKFDGLVPEPASCGEGLTMESLLQHPDYEKIYGDERYEKVNRQLVEAMAGGKRFGSMKLNAYINVVEKEWETQFSAITFLPQGEHPFVAFRGTDETIVGWKEDFNMAFKSPVPGQEYSVKYLNMTASMMAGPFYVGGHSKGGNLAVYSAMNCEKSIQDRILKIYSMDGPGFPPDILQKCDYAAIEDRLTKILPHSSLIGMLFEPRMRFEVVESKAISLAQHNPYTWKVEGTRLKRAEDLYQIRKDMDNTLNQWILSLNEEQMKVFVDTLFGILEASKADNLIQLTSEWKTSISGMMNAARQIDDETMQILKKVIHSLVEMAGANMISETKKLVEEKVIRKKQG